MTALEAIEHEIQRRDLPPFRSGDTVRVHVKIREGDKERTQVFEGVVIRRRNGGGSGSFTVRKISYGVGVERIFPLGSPSVEKIEIKSRGHVRRSRLYYLRELKGKNARLRSNSDACRCWDPRGGPSPAPRHDAAGSARPRRGGGSRRK